jgi:hypothetical protein
MLRKLSRLGTGVAAALACGFVMGAWSAPVQAEPLYRWESADGTVSFTDDAKRVPERYRESAKQIDTSVLSGYGRYTPTDAAASQEYAKRLNERLEVLRAANRADQVAAEPDEVAVEGGATPAQKRYIQERRRMHDGRYRYYRTEAPQTASLPVDPDDPNPVVTEYKHVKVPGQPITQTVIVTRQGDRVLSVTPRTPLRYHKMDFGNLSDYEN